MKVWLFVDEDHDDNSVDGAGCRSDNDDFF